MGGGEGSHLFLIHVPLCAGNSFVGRIRFENLSAVELGAMCHLFKLGKKENICYKLGMGKPIGMGTVKISAELHIQEDDYYKKLFDDKGFVLCDEVKTLESFTSEFDNYMRKKEEEWDKKGTCFRDIHRSRIKQLEMIMDTSYMGIKNNEKKWENATRYIEIPEGKSKEKEEGQQTRENEDRDIIKNRLILPSIEEVVNRFKGRNK